MNPKMEAFYGQFSPAAPEVFYDRKHNSFVIKQTGDPFVQDWVSLPKIDACEMLSEQGVDGGPSIIAAARNNTTKTVDYVGALGGYPRGFHRVGSFNALVTSGPRIPKAVQGDWDYIRRIIEDLFGPQAVYIYTYLALSRRQLINMILRGMPAIIMVGPRNCGKSFFQSHIMTPFLGGRGVNVSKNMSGEEHFSGVIYQNEHLIMGDAKLSTAAEKRRFFGSRIKELVATEEQTMRVMYVDPLPVKTLSRLSISLNDEIENIGGLPILDDSLEDKMMIFRVGQVNWPVLAYTPEDLEKFRLAVVAQVPAFCWWLENEFTIPEALTRDAAGKPARFCMNHYHDPEIVRALTEVSPEYSLMEYIKQCYFVAPVLGSGTKRPDTIGKEIRMTALELSQGLTDDSSPVRHNARSLLNGSGARITTLLNRLQAKFGENVFMKRTATERVWVIRDIDTVLGSALL